MHQALCSKALSVTCSTYVGGWGWFSDPVGATRIALCWGVPECRRHRLERRFKKSISNAFFPFQRLLSLGLHLKKRGLFAENDYTILSCLFKALTILFRLSFYGKSEVGPLYNSHLFPFGFNLVKRGVGYFSRMILMFYETGSSSRIFSFR